MEAGSDIGHHTKWNFSMEKCPSKDFIKSKVDISPVAIAFDITHNFQFIGNVSKKSNGLVYMSLCDTSNYLDQLTKFFLLLSEYLQCKRRRHGRWRCRGTRSSHCRLWLHQRK